MPEFAEGAACRNCQQTLAQPLPPYCPACGQETRLRPPTVADFMHQFAGSYLSVEGELWRTLKLLFTRPGALTQAYLAGRRRHYVLPLRLYLSISLVVMLIITAVVQARLEAAPVLRFDLPSSNLVLVDMGVLRVAVDRGHFICHGLPQSVCLRLAERNLSDPDGLWQRVTTAGVRAVGQVGTAMFVLVPLFALLLRGAYLGRGLRYAEHLVFALHLHAFCFVVLAVMLLQWPGISMLGVGVMLSYTLLAARRVYGGPWWALLLRWAVLVLVYAVLLNAALLALVLASMLR